MTEAEKTTEAQSGLRRASLFWRVFISNAIVLCAAFAALAITPVTISDPVAAAEVAVLVVGIGVLLVVDWFLLRRTFAPLERIARLMRDVDPLDPGERLPRAGTEGEVADLTRSFNEMLDRLEGERRDSARRALAAQERERRRVAHELHDEIGQTLTAVVLQLERFSRQASPDIAGELADVRETARKSLEDVRRIARELRPEALDDLGLVSALTSLSSQMGERTRLDVRRRMPRSLPALSPEAELVIYRVAQESLTNVARHADASRVELSLAADNGAVTLLVRDDGSGLDRRMARTSTSGIRGMRERAVLVGADLEIGPADGGGTEVRLEVPLGGDAEPDADAGQA